jgi:hypothetical protein
MSNTLALYNALRRIRAADHQGVGSLPAAMSVHCPAATRSSHLNRPLHEVCPNFLALRARISALPSTFSYAFVNRKTIVREASRGNNLKWRADAQARVVPQLSVSPP